jgi:simple sugar transport system permease protein
MQVIFDNFANILIAAFGMMVPFVLASLGGIYSVRSGVMALGIESMMMTGCFTSVVGAYMTGSAVVGLLTGILGGMVFGLFHAILCVRYRVNQIISGIGLNLLATAITTLTMQLLWDSKGNSPQVNGISLKLGKAVSWIPLLGKVLAPQSILFGVAVILVVVSWFILFRTKYGLRMRVVGENPTAAKSLGLPVHRLKYIGVLISGALAGLGGSYLAIDHLHLFVRDMTSGRGYIAVAITIMSRYNPISAFFCALLFGASEAVQIYMQGQNIPSQIIQMLPYIVTLLVLTFGIRNIKPPAGVGRHED